jgi:hypothetical protein
MLLTALPEALAVPTPLREAFRRASSERELIEIEVETSAHEVVRTTGANCERGKR